MIHSLAGGSFREKRIKDFALVEILDEPYKAQKFWYLTGGVDVATNDKVIVPVKAHRLSGVVIRVDRAVPEGQTPVPINIAKEIIKKVDE